MRIRIAYSLAKMGCVLLVIQWFFVTLFYHHNQHHSLAPDDYDVEIVSAAELERLADRSQPTVALENGTQKTKADAWYDVMLPKYKAIDGGRRYVLVTAKGTAHFAERWRRDMLPMAAVFVLIALVLRPLSREEEAKAGVRKKQPKPAPSLEPLSAEPKLHGGIG